MTFITGSGAVAVLLTAWWMGTATVAGLLWWGFGRGWWLLLCLLVLLVGTMYWPFWIRSVYGELDNRRLYLRVGVIWRRELTVPRVAFRTMEYLVPPLHRIFGCCTVVLRFAGGSVWVPLLDVETVNRLKAQMEGG